MFQASRTMATVTPRALVAATERSFSLSLSLSLSLSVFVLPLKREGVPHFIPPFRESESVSLSTSERLISGDHHEDVKEVGVANAAFDRDSLTSTQTQRVSRFCPWLWL